MSSTIINLLFATVIFGALVAAGCFHVRLGTKQAGPFTSAERLRNRTATASSFSGSSRAASASSTAASSRHVR